MLTIVLTLQSFCKWPCHGEVTLSYYKLACNATQVVCQGRKFVNVTLCYLSILIKLRLTIVTQVSLKQICLKVRLACSWSWTFRSTVDDQNPIIWQFWFPNWLCSRSRELLGPLHIEIFYFLWIPKYSEALSCDIPPPKPSAWQLNRKCHPLYLQKWLAWWTSTLIIVTTCDDRFVWNLLGHLIKC